MIDSELRKRLKSSFGFTIVELLLVVGLIVLLASATGGSWAKAYKKSAVRKTASEFLLAAKYARLCAVEKQRSCKLVLDHENNTFFVMGWVVDGDSGLAEQKAISNQYTKPVKLDGGVVFEEIKIVSISSSDGQGEEAIVFNANGSASSAIVQIGDGKYHYTVYILAATGKAQLITGTAKESPVDIIDLDEI